MTTGARPIGVAHRWTSGRWVRRRLALMKMMSVVSLTAVLAALTPCSGAAATPTAEPGAPAIPMAPAPFGLGGVVLPRCPAEIEALFARLPLEIAGESRPRTNGDRLVPNTGERYQVDYGSVASGLGPPLLLQALDVSTGAFWPAGWTADQVVAAMTSGADWTVEGYGRDGDLFWIQWRTTAVVAGSAPGTPEKSRPIYTLSWGRIGEPWLFGAAADRPERLPTLVAAFVEATRSVVTPAA